MVANGWGSCLGGWLEIAVFQNGLQTFVEEQMPRVIGEVQSLFFGDYSVRGIRYSRKLSKDITCVEYSG